MSRGNRRQGRELALQIIFAMPDHRGDVRQLLRIFWENFVVEDDVLGEYPADPSGVSSPRARHFAEELVCGVADHQQEIDKHIKDFSTNWTLERMARVDLSLLRLAVFELLYCPGVPVNVIINEAIEIGKRFGTKETPAFVNGILDKISVRRRPAAARASAHPGS
jgi:N utilization substance protein B